MSDFAGKAALVTGAARGLGREVALSLAAAGANVMIADVTEAEAEEVAAECRTRGPDAAVSVTDVTSEEDVAALLRQTVETFGRLDVACNNAGVEGPICSMVDLSFDDWQRVIGVNLTGVWLSMKHEIGRFLAQGDGGAIVNICSVMGHVGTPGITAYNAAKHGVLGLTRTAALEYAETPIRINAVSPGGIRTTIVERTEQTHPEKIAALVSATPMARLAQPVEIAEAVLWLLSDASSYVTGHSLVVDGGYTCQ